MQPTLPPSGQLIMNECALAIVALRVPRPKMATPTAVAHALLSLPSIDVEAFHRLEYPVRYCGARTCGSGAGVAARCGRIDLGACSGCREFFLVRARAYISLFDICLLISFRPRPRFALLAYHTTRLPTRK